MRNLLAFFAAVSLTVAGLGWYLGWYKVQSAPGQPGRRNVNIEVNTVKIGADIQRGSERLQDLLNKDSKAKDGDKTKSAAGKEGRAEPRDIGGAELSEHP